MAVIYLLSFFLLCGMSVYGDHNHGTQKTRPNIIVIIADDMGFNDVSFHGSNEIPTPNIDALAYNGVILNTHYTQALCTPSRAALLTGKYPIHLGMQHLVILEPEPWGVPLNETLLPERLKRNGYKTHAVGKWHLGFFKKEYTPTYRGFDSHFGYWQGMQDYYEHTVHATFTSEFGYDMRRNMSVDWDSKGKYSTTLFTQEAVKLIREHDVSSPMFMYLAHLAPHSGGHEALQAPDEEIAKFSHIQDPERRVYAAMVSMLDRSVGEVITALREKHMLENSIILFMSDNGAKSEGLHANHGSNYPLRGLKNSPWEGGMRCVSAIWSPLIKKPQRVSNELMHISDWLPTLYAAAGLNSSELAGDNLDGKDMWKMISEGAKSPRTDFVYNIDDIWNYAAIRQGDWKYVYRTTIMKTDVWYGSSGNYSYVYPETEILTSPAGVALNALNTYRQIAEGANARTQLLTAPTIRKLRNEATLQCRPVTADDEQAPDEKCDPLISPCLFNIRADPCERVNLATARPLMLINLEAALMNIRRTVRAPINVPRDPLANPDNWNGTWTNWQDYDLNQRVIFDQALSPINIILIASSSLLVFLVLAVIIVLVKVKNIRRRKSCKGNQYGKTATVEDPADFSNNKIALNGD